MGGSLTIRVPLLPPSVNHYVTHGVRRGRLYHSKTPEALAFESAFAKFVRGQFVTGNRFCISIRHRMGPGDSFDVDNLNKCVLDSAARFGMIRNPKGAMLSDRWFKRMIVDMDEDHRELGQQVEITIEAMP